MTTTPRPKRPAPPPTQEDINGYQPTPQETWDAHNGDSGQ